MIVRILLGKVPCVPVRAWVVGLLAAVSVAGPATLRAQVNVSGKPGLLYIPSARLVGDGTFWLGAAYNPLPNAFRFNTPVARSSETVYFVNLVVLPRLEVNVNLLIPNETVPLGARGIGDRQLDVKWLCLTERGSRPAVALILSAPFGIDNSLETYALVATKTWQLDKSWQAELTAGVGSPYYIYRDQKNDRNSSIFSNFSLRDKRLKNNRYLSGPFGGLVLRYRQIGGLLVEWDSQHLNVGAYATVAKRWTVQGGWLSSQAVTLGTSYAFSLQKLPKSPRLQP